ncbi:MAG: hypothetical protein V4710_04145, partial [Verrucomicrobiota bacterium]
GTGFTDLPAGSTLKITGAGHQLQRRIDNAGAATWNTGIRVDSRDGALFNNIGTLDIEDDGSFSFDAVGVRTVFTNTGTVTKSGGTATFFFSDVAFNNRGTVNIESGALNFNGGGISTGLFQVDGGTSLIFGGGSHSLSPTSRVTGDGTVRFTNGEVDIDGSYDAHTTVITNGTAYFDVTGSTRLLQQSGGELGGAGTFSVRTTFTWSGGSQSGTGITELPAGSTLEITGLGHKLQRRLDNAGAGTWNTTARIDSGNGAIFNNQGSLEILSDGSLSYNLGGVQTVFNNSGLLQKTGGTVATSFANVVLNNSGAIVAGSGTLNFNGPFTQTSGTTELNGGALFTVGTLNFAGGDLTGSGTITGNVSNTGATVFPGGIEASGVIEITGNYTQGAGGTLAIEIGGLVAGQDFDQLDVGGTADLNGTLDLALINSYSAPAGSSFETLRYGAQSGFFTALTGEPGFTQSYQAAALFVVRGALDYVWNGSVSDDWFTPENWTPNGIPGAADNASIDEAPHAVNVSGQNAAINDLNLRDNTLFGNARLDVGGTMTWTGGEIRLNTNIASLLNISGIESKLLRGNNGGGGGILNIAHGANVAWSGGTLFLQDFAVINNAGTFDAQSENINPSGNNFSTFNNLAGGLFTKTNSGTTGIAPLIRFVNHGTLHANAGALVEINDLTLNEGSLFTGAGVTQAINGLLLISGNTQIAADATFELAGSQANGAGTFGGAGTFLWTSGRLQGELSIESGGMLVMDGFGNKVIRGDSTGTHGILTISPGATALLKGSGDLRMQDQGI